MKRILSKFGIIGCILVLCLGVAVGCSGMNGNLSSEQQEGQAYMSKVNGIMDKLGKDLDSFVEATSRGDLVNMRTQAENAYQSLDELSKLEAPEQFKDVQQSYTDGTSKLREALDAYIELYTDVNGKSFNQATYESRLKSVQSLYDEGVDLLKKGDDLAAEQLKK